MLYLTSSTSFDGVVVQTFIGVLALHDRALTADCCLECSAMLTTADCRYAAWLLVYQAMHCVCATNAAEGLDVLADLLALSQKWTKSVGGCCSTPAPLADCTHCLC